MIDYLNERPMLISAVGCALSAVCVFYSKAALAVCLIVFSGLLMLSVFRKNASLSVAFLLTVMMTVSCFISTIKISSLNEYSDSVITADICIYETTYKSDGYYISEVETVSEDVLPKNTKLTLYHTPLSVATGEILSAKIKLNKIDDKYKASSYSKGIYLSGNTLEMKRTARKDTVLTAAQRLKSYIKNNLFRNMEYESAATMSALVFGDRGYFTDEFYGNVKSSGVAHAMVVSGMHLTILVGLVLKITESFVYNSYLKALIMFSTVIVLCGVCGFTMSILRAGVTYIIMAFGLLLCRPYSGENALGGAFTFISIVSPYAIFSIGFQLSLLSTFGILGIAMPICKVLKPHIKSNILLKLCQSVILSISAAFMTLPVVIYVFGYISVVSVVTNLLIDFPLSFCLCATVIALIIKPVLPFFGTMVLNTVDYGVRYINFVINYLGSRKFAVLRINEEGVYISVILIFAVFKIMLTCKRRQDMLKLKQMNEKILKERGKDTKWQSFLRKR